MEDFLGVFSLRTNHATCCAKLSTMQVASSAWHLCTVPCCMPTSTVGSHDEILDCHCECCQFSGVATTFHTQGCMSSNWWTVSPYLCVLPCNVQISMQWPQVGMHIVIVADSEFVNVHHVLDSVLYCAMYILDSIYCTCTRCDEGASLINPPQAEKLFTDLCTWKECPSVGF